MPREYEQANVQLSALLKESQKKQLLEDLGEPLAFAPSGTAPAVLCEGAKHFAFPRPTTRDTGRSSFGIGRSGILNSSLTPRILAQEALREELKLAPEIAAALPPCSDDHEELPRFLNEVGRALQPAQVERLRQLELQTIERHSGRLALFECDEVVKTLVLSEEQRTAIGGLIRAKPGVTRLALVAAVERNPELRSKWSDKGADRLVAILTPVQLDRLTTLFW